MERNKHISVCILTFNAKSSCVNSNGNSCVTVFLPPPFTYGMPNLILMIHSQSLPNHLQPWHTCGEGPRQPHFIFTTPIVASGNRSLPD